MDYSVIKRDGKIVAGRLVVYRGELEMHTVFISTESVHWLNKYIQYRKDHGEDIRPDSPLFRDKFDPIKGQYGHGKSESLRAVPMSPHAVRQYYNRLLYTIGLRKQKKRRHDFSVHSYRKWFKTHCEMGGMRPIDIETLLNHSTGISDSYYHPTENDLLNEYLLVVDNLGSEHALRTELESQRKMGSEFEEINKKHEEEMKLMYDKMDRVMELIQQNSELANAKPEALTRKKK